jgi:sterol desaturase/sphingolipid hydroxylase (fatty acid hydroxylase superfamily)
MPHSTSDPIATIGTILAAMALVAAVETLVPLHARDRRHRDHLAPNLALTLLTFATNLVFNGALAAGVVALDARGLGALPLLALPDWLAAVVAGLAQDIWFYVAHVAMPRVPALWRVHRVHHSDPALDVTTTIRQHPAEGLIRYVAMAAFALPLGVGPGAFAFYRLASALSGLLEHANVRVSPCTADRLALVVTWPTMHKVHHARDARYTDTNYGNLVSWWDRACGTFTPAHLGATIAVGLDGHDDPAAQTTRGLLALPFRRTEAADARAPEDVTTLTPERC